MKGLIVVALVLAAAGTATVLWVGVGEEPATEELELGGAPVEAEAPRAAPFELESASATEDTEREVEADDPIPEPTGEIAIRGRVTDEGGRPLAGARVRPVGVKGNRLEFAGPERVVIADADGNYAVPGPLGATPLLGAEADGIGLRVRGPLPPTEGVRTIDFPLGTGLRLAGRAVFADGTPAAGARVDVLGRFGPDDVDDVEDVGVPTFREEHVRIASVTVDASGAFFVRGLGRGPWRVAASIARDDGEGRWATLVDDVPPSTNDLELVLGPPLDLVVDVRDDRGEPVPEVRLAAISHAAWAPGSGEAAMTAVDESQAEDGLHVIPGLARGTYHVRAERKGWTYPEGNGWTEVVLPREGDPLVLSLVRPGSLSGRVVDHLGQPLGGAKVRADSGRQRVGEVECDQEDGTFAHPVVPAGRATLTATAGLGRAQLVVEVEPGGEYEDLELRFPEAGAIRGVVLGPDGNPLHDCDVIVLEHTRILGSTESGDDGRFEFVAVPAGTFQVIAILKLEKGRDFDLLVREEASVVVGKVTELVLRPDTDEAVELFGRVTAGGEPAAKVDLLVFRDGAHILDSVRTAKTDVAGEYSVRLDRPGGALFMLKANYGSVPIDYAVVPRAGRHRHDVDIPVGSISGRVLDGSGNPVSGVPLSILREDQWLQLRLPTEDIRVRSDEDGRYHFGSVLEGTYTVRVIANGASPRGYRPVRGIDVGHGEAVRDIDLVPAPSGTLRGFVRARGGRGVARAAVWILEADGLRLLAATVTNAQGWYEMRDLPAGSVALAARAPGLAGRTIASAEVIAGEAVSAPLGVARATLLTVTPVDGNGDPVGAVVEIEDSAGRDITYLSSPHLLRGFDATFSTKRQTLGPHPPGTYEVTAVAPDGRRGTGKVKLAGEEEVELEVVVR